MFEWDDDKNASDIAKHGLSFEKAAQIFDGPVVTSIDDRIDYGEVRHISIGSIGSVLIIVIAHTDRNGKSASFLQGQPRNARENDMPTRYAEELDNKTLSALSDSDIDTSEIPDLDDDFWVNGKVVDLKGTISGNSEPTRSPLAFPLPRSIILSGKKREEATMYKFEVYKDKAGEFRFRFKASNGQSMFSSEGYAAKASAIAAIESIKKNAPAATVDDQTTAVA